MISDRRLRTRRVLELISAMAALEADTALAYTRDALAILEGNLRLYSQGAPECYRVLASQLRLLLCDTNRVHDRLVDISLVPRVLPDLRLAALQPVPPAGGPLRFQPGPGTLSLAAWLAQEIPGPGGRPVSLHELIRTICEQDGGAHVDQRPLPGLRGWGARSAVVASLSACIAAALAPLLEPDEHRAA